MQNIPSMQVRRFQKWSLLKLYASAMTGFYLGLKVCDYFFFDPKTYEIMREEMEDEFWAKNGEPVHLKPYTVPSVIPGKEGSDRKSWIYIMYEKDKLVKKKEELEA